MLAFVTVLSLTVSGEPVTAVKAHSWKISEICGQALRRLQSPSRGLAMTSGRQQSNSAGVQLIALTRNSRRQENWQIAKVPAPQDDLLPDATLPQGPF